MNPNDLKICPCHHPDDLCVQDREIKSASPVIMPTHEIRILCDNCGRVSPWCMDFDTAAKFWNESIDKETVQAKEKKMDKKLLSEIGHSIIMAKASLNDAHRVFNDESVKNSESIGDEERKVWNAVVAALDAIGPVYDWALDKI